MKSEVSQEQIDYYQENGFVVIEDFLSNDEVDYWRNTLEEVITGRGDNMLPGRKGLDPQDGKSEEQAAAAVDDANTKYYGNVFVQRVNLWQDSPKVKELILSPEIGKMATYLAGVEGFRVWHDQALYKAPWSNPTAWHKDNPYWSYYSPDAISIWIALDDVSPDNGCLYFIPGSHRPADYKNVGISPNIGAIFEACPEYAKIEPVKAEMKAGSCSFHNGLTVHGASPNMTPRWRRAMTCGFMPIGSTYNGQRNILTEEQVSRLKEGDVLEDDEQNPIVYSRSWETANI